ncbi:biotin synthase auxiliary protein BsaP [Kribbella sp. NPDC054772]
MRTAVVEVYCGHCGRPEADGGHHECRRSLELEPPRYCVECRRRMVVQVHPMGWSARCSVHGDITSD